VREAVSRDLGRAIMIGRRGSDRGGVEWLRAALFISAVVGSPKLKQACARGVPGLLGLGREGEAMNPRAEGKERQREGIGRTGATPARHSGHGEGA
jgi:hypothetical protein